MILSLVNIVKEKFKYHKLFWLKYGLLLGILFIAQSIFNWDEMTFPFLLGFMLGMAGIMSFIDIKFPPKK